MNDWEDMTDEQRIFAITFLFKQRQERQQICENLGIKRGVFDQFCVKHKLSAARILGREAAKKAQKLSKRRNPMASPVWSRDEDMRRRDFALRASEGARAQLIKNREGA